MAKALLAAWLCIAACALLTVAFASITSFDAIAVGIGVSLCAVLPLLWLDRHRAARRDLTYEDDESG